MVPVFSTIRGRRPYSESLSAAASDPTPPPTRIASYVGARSSPSPSTCSVLISHAPENGLGDLARRRLGQLVQEAHVLRLLIRAKVCGDRPGDFVIVGSLPRLE